MKAYYGLDICENYVTTYPLLAKKNESAFAKMSYIVAVEQDQVSKGNSAWNVFRKIRMRTQIYYESSDSNGNRNKQKRTKEEYEELLTAFLW